MPCTKTFILVIISNIPKEKKEISQYAEAENIID